MAGSVWPTLVAGSRVKASHLDAKFKWIENDIVPMIGGTRIDATYDIGSTTYRFRDANFKGAIKFGDGSVGAPSLAPGADTATGRWHPTVYTTADSVGGIEAMRIKSDGTVLRHLQPLFSASYVGATGTTGTGTENTLTTGWTETTDTHSAFNASTGIFTAPYDGDYLLTASFRLYTFNSASSKTITAQTISIYKGSQFIGREQLHNTWSNELVTVGFSAFPFISSHRGILSIVNEFDAGETSYLTASVLGLAANRYSCDAKFTAILL